MKHAKAVLSLLLGLSLIMAACSNAEKRKAPITAEDASEAVKQSAEYKALTEKHNNAVTATAQELKIDDANKLHNFIPEIKREAGWLVGFGAQNESYIWQLDEKGKAIAKISGADFSAGMKSWAQDFIKKETNKIERTTPIQ